MLLGTRTSALRLVARQADKLQRPRVSQCVEPEGDEYWPHNTFGAICGEHAAKAESYCCTLAIRLTPFKRFTVA